MGADINVKPDTPLPSATVNALRSRALPRSGDVSRAGVNAGLDQKRMRP